jgi:AcrR family transcriptional regulator
MYNGTNPTALNSRQWLCDALMTLMKKQTYGTITVLDICHAADLSRQTFYNFFSSKEDILHFIIQTQVNKQVDQLPDSIGMKDAVNASASVLNDSRELFNLMIANHLDHIITEEIRNCISMFADHFSVQSKNATRPYGEAFLCGALSETMLCWFKSDHPLSTSALCSLLTQILQGNYYQFNS